jgi:POT family proton-dependent oligopeptide transporter
MSSDTNSINTAADVSIKHPAGLWVLFTTEMWERFAYYAMRAILVLYLVSETTKQTAPGLGWSEKDAYTLYGWYTGLVYLTPLLGGWLADKFLGQRFSVVIGAATMALGEFFLASTEIVRNSFGGEVNFAVNATFFAGLTLMVIGNGFFKPNISVMVGQLYKDDTTHTLRDAAFTIFYMGINIGAFFSPLIAGTLGEKFGFEYGFLAAGIGMLIGLCSFTFFGKYIRTVGNPPQKYKFGGVSRQEPVSGNTPLQTAVSGRLSTADYQKIAVIIILTLFSVFFFMAFEQAGSSLNVFAKDRTDRQISDTVEHITPSFIATYFIKEDGKTLFPATWYQSVNPLGIIIFAPLFVMLWTALAGWKFEPSTPVKFAIGLILVGCGYLVMIPGAIEAQKAGLAAAYWLIAVYVLQTWGELCLSPVGLSMVTKLAPHRYQSLLMGIWLLGSCVAQIAAGYVAAHFGTGEGTSFFFGKDGGLADFFLFISFFPLVCGVIALAMSPLLKKWMHGVN